MNPGGAWGWVQETPPDCLIILIFGTIWFIIYYADQFKRWGTLSIGAWLIGFDFYLKIIFMYPFAYSKENIHDVAQKFYIILAHLDQALRISAVGALAMMFGPTFPPSVKMMSCDSAIAALPRFRHHRFG